MSESAENALDAYQRVAARTINPALTDDERLLDAVAGLAEEGGEALSHVRKYLLQGRALDHDALVIELGDALWCVAIAAQTLGVSLSDVAARNQEKLAKRWPDGR